MALDLDGSVKWLKSAYRSTAQFFGVGCAEKDDVAMLIQINLKTGSKSENMTFSSKENKITKRAEGNHTEFMLHSMALPNATKFVRSAKCSVKEVS